jgi:hypothetical protein
MRKKSEEAQCVRVRLWVAYFFQLEADSLFYAWPLNDADREHAVYLEELSAQVIRDTFDRAGISSERARAKAWREAVKSFSEVD